MNKKLIIMLLALMLLASPMVGVAGTPVDITVNYMVTSDTNFGVSYTLGSNPMNFTGTREETGIIPDGLADSEKFATITNSGDVSQSFNVKLNSNNPSGIVLKIANTVAMTGAITASSSAQTPAGWGNVAPTTSVDMFVRADFNGAADNTYTRTLTINSGLPTSGGTTGGCVTGTEPECF